MFMGYPVMRLEGFGTAFNEGWAAKNDCELYMELTFTPNSIYTETRNDRRSRRLVFRRVCLFAIFTLSNSPRALCRSVGRVLCACSCL